MHGTKVSYFFKCPLLCAYFKMYVIIELNSIMVLILQFLTRGQHHLP